MTSRFEDTTPTSTAKSNNTTGVGFNLNIGKGNPEYVGLFLNIQKGSLIERLIIDEEGKYCLKTLGKILSMADTEKVELYMTGTKKIDEEDIQSVKSALGL